jgi:hypothetical protein
MASALDYIKSALIECNWWGVGAAKPPPQNLFLVRPLAGKAGQRPHQKQAQ